MGEGGRFLGRDSGLSESPDGLFARTRMRASGLHREQSQGGVSFSTQASFSQSATASISAAFRRRVLPLQPRLPVACRLLATTA